MVVPYLMQFSHQLHRVRVRIHKTSLFQTPVSSIRSPGYPYFCSTWLQSQGFHNPLLRLDNMLEPQETQGNVYLYLPSYYKGYIWTVRWREAPRWSPKGSQAQELMSLGSWGVQPSKNMNLFINPDALQTLQFTEFYGGFTIPVG